MHTQHHCSHSKLEESVKRPNRLVQDVTACSEFDSGQVTCDGHKLGLSAINPVYMQRKGPKLGFAFDSAFLYRNL
jgi:hypothetical protein